MIDEKYHLILDYLKFYELTHMKEIIWKGVEPWDVLTRIRHLYGSRCPKLMHIIWVVNLPCLERLLLPGCINMKQAIWAEAEERGGKK